MIFAALLSGMASHASAGSCRLSPDQCQIVFEERRNLNLEQEIDCQATRCWSYYPHSVAVADRAEQRMRDRLRSLPKPIGDELARLMLCDAEDRYLATGGEISQPRNCR